MKCEQEMCPNWSGEGDVCPCALFGLEPPRPAGDEDREALDRTADQW